MPPRRRNDSKSRGNSGSASGGKLKDLLGKRRRKQELHYMLKMTVSLFFRLFSAIRYGFKCFEKPINYLAGALLLLIDLMLFVLFNAVAFVLSVILTMFNKTCSRAIAAEASTQGSRAPKSVEDSRRQSRDRDEGSRKARVQEEEGPPDQVLRPSFWSEPTEYCKQRIEEIAEKVAEYLQRLHEMIQQRGQVPEAAGSGAATPTSSTAPPGRQDQVEETAPLLGQTPSKHGADDKGVTFSEKTESRKTPLKSESRERYARESKQSGSRGPVSSSSESDGTSAEQTPCRGMSEKLTNLLEQVQDALEELKEQERAREQASSSEGEEMTERKALDASTSETRRSLSKPDSTKSLTRSEPTKQPDSATSLPGVADVEDDALEQTPCQGMSASISSFMNGSKQGSKTEHKVASEEQLPVTKGESKDRSSLTKGESKDRPPFTKGESKDSSSKVQAEKRKSLEKSESQSEKGEAEDTALEQTPCQAMSASISGLLNGSKKDSITEDKTAGQEQSPSSKAEVSQETAQKTDKPPAKTESKKSTESQELSETEEPENPEEAGVEESPYEVIAAKLSVIVDTVNEAIQSFTAEDKSAIHELSDLEDEEEPGDLSDEEEANKKGKDKPTSDEAANNKLPEEKTTSVEPTPINEGQ